MSICTLIIGQSGTGKTTSLRTLDPEKCVLIKSIRKPLPFRGSEWDKVTVVTDNCKEILKIISQVERSNKEILIIDDMQYLMSNEYMRRSSERGWDKFTEMAKNLWEIINKATNVRPTLRIYFLSHSQEDEHGEKIRVKTIGKLLDVMITLEGMFSIVLRSQRNEGKYFFSTQNDGNDTVKSPMGLFKDERIDNDLKEIDNKIKKYYIINNDNNQSE